VLGDCELVAFVNVTDGPRARAFYVDVLGLRLVAETPYAVVLDANGTTLRVALSESVTPAPGTVLGWAVPDITGVVDSLAAAGVPMAIFDGMPQDDRGVWTTPTGEQVGWFRDPDGNVLSVTQS
jgi:catechol 2,3-dioxygenase-like lactoylglutathione lyase family enzyme